jgi:AraC family transcriptional regulator of adaptative response / DNA-3-methyladenine glycosylase II
MQLDSQIHSQAEISRAARYQLRFEPPFAWRSILAFLALRAIPGVEAIALERYRRSIALNGNRGYFEVSCDEESHSLRVDVYLDNPAWLGFIAERVRVMFDLDADYQNIVRTLERDPLLASRLKIVPGLRVPGCWNPFELAVRAILGQQITVRAATTLAGRLAAAFGEPFSPAITLAHLFPTPQVLADGDLSVIGLPKARAETIRALARAVCDGSLDLEHAACSQMVLQKLLAIKGIGRWTAQYIAMRALSDRDAFPSADLGLLRALDMASSPDLESRAEAWRPWRAYAAIYLWTVPLP